MTERYRPSNATEGDAFEARWCRSCVRHDPVNDVYCPIIGAAMTFDIEDPEYPEAWQYGDDGKPVCAKHSTKQSGTSPFPTDADKAYLAWLAERDAARSLDLEDSK